MGISGERNPDKSYVLTRDNFIKILGIQMRFRLVHIETGPGVRFMIVGHVCENGESYLIYGIQIEEWT